MFGADLDSAIAMNLLAKISETCRARDLSRRVTVQRIVTVQRTRTSDKVLSTSDSITRRRTVSNFLWVRLVRDVQKPDTRNLFLP